MNNLDLWHKVEKTNPKYTKQANVKGNKITAISPQYQILNATEHFGSYGGAWGFKTIELDFTLSSSGLIIFEGLFFYPGGQFPIINSIGMYKDNAKTKIDDDFAKKVETDALTKALSKLGFNADIFMGKFDDHRYVSNLIAEFMALDNPDITLINEMIDNNDVQGVKYNWSELIASNWSILSEDQTKKLNSLFST
tara:strand:+ start:17 stop:601 length:585 start_codon:yes stop_codon:yes gene_type:complete